MAVDDKQEKIPPPSLDDYQQQAEQQRENWARRQKLTWRFLKFFTLGFVIAALTLGSLTIGLTFLFYAKGLSLLNYLPFATTLLNPWTVLTGGLLLSVTGGALVGLYAVIKGHNALKKAEDNARAVDAIIGDEELYQGDELASSPGHTIYEMVESQHYTELMDLRSRELFWHFSTRFSLGFLISSLIIGTSLFSISLLFFAKGTALLDTLPYATYIMNPWIQAAFATTLSFGVGLICGSISVKNAKSAQSKSYALGGSENITTTDVQIRYPQENLINMLERETRVIMLPDRANTRSNSTNTLDLLMQIGYNADDSDDTPREISLPDTEDAILATNNQHEASIETIEGTDHGEPERLIF